MENSKKCALVVSSCDAYSDILDIFFKLLKKYWPNINYDIYLSTESLNYSYKGLTINNIHPKSKDDNWTIRMYDLLSQINYKNVIFLLDDFFLYDFVDANKIEQCINWLNLDTSIATFTIWQTSIGESGLYPGFKRINNKSKIVLSAIAGIWNRKKFLYYLKNRNENIWQWELSSNKKINHSIRNDKAFFLSHKEKMYIPYDSGKIGLFSGQWMEDTKALFKKEGISMDYSKRGIYDPALRGKSKSIINTFELDSLIVANFNLEHKGTSVYKPKINKIENGYFYQKYVIKNAKEMLRWELSTTWGFSISNLVITIHYSNKEKEIINNNVLFGSFLYNDKSLIINSMSPYIYIPLKKNANMTKIEISGKYLMPANDEQLRKSYNYVTPGSTSELLDKANQLFNEFLVSKEKVSYISLDSRLIEIKNNQRIIHDWEENNKKRFTQKYNISSKSNYVEWYPSTSSGYSIANLKIHIIKNDKSVKKIGHKEIINAPSFVKNQYIFFGDNNIKIPVKNAKQIVISGKMIVPMSSKILRKIIFR